MDTEYSTNRKFNRVLANILSIFVILAIAFPATIVAYAAPKFPFSGQWEATDVDGSDMTLSIAGRPTGPFQITWTDDYISLCDGEAGIVRGTGWLNEGNSNLLEADVHLECFTTGATLDFHVTFRYHPATNTLSIRWSFGQFTIWHRPGEPQPLPPTLNLRVNYGDNWVESFYEGGHTAWVTVTESDGVTVKATTELITEPKDYWNGETGFQTNDSAWFDQDGNQLESPPDIRPNDWVYGWVDNGASAQVQIGDIGGVVDLTTDSIAGTISATWFSDEVNVECHPWGAPQPTEMKFDTIQPNGVDPYSCSWAGEWDIRSGEPVGVGYFGEDGHWVANVFRNPRFDVFPEWNVVEGWEWPEKNTITATVAGKDECIAEGVANYPSDNPWSTFVSLNFPEGCDIVAEDVVTLSDGTTTLTHMIRNLAITEVNKAADTIAGTADIGALVYAWVHNWYDQTQMQLTVEDGTWLADFGSKGFDLIENMCGRSEIRDELGNATSVDWCIPNPHFSVFPEWEYVEGWEWPDGAPVTAVVEGKPECSVEGNSGHPDWDPNELFVPLWFPEGCDIAFGDVVTLTDGDVARTHTVQKLAITAVDKDANTITGTADPGAIVHVWPHGYNELLPITGENGTWLANFNSIGIDLVEGMAGRTEIRDEMGNATAVGWRIPNPHFSVFPDWKYIEGYEWPNGASVTATVDGKPECSADGIAGYPEWDRWNTFVSMNFPEDCNVDVGNVVTLTDGATTRTHTVRNLAITAVDQEANTVSGIADVGQVVHVWPHGYNELLPTTGEDGTWLADFDSIGIDLVEGMCGRSEIRDEAGNATAAPDWCIPSPRLIAFPAVEQIFGYNWPEGSEVHLTINDPPDFEQTVTVTPSSWDPNDILAYFDFGASYDLKPGDVVTLSGSGMDRTYTVRNLSVTSVDAAADTVSGTADPGTEVMVYPFEFGNQPLRVTAGEDGNWLANFADAGIDLVEGMCGRSDIFDEFANSTTVDWCISPPPPPARIVVQITDDWFRAENFAPNTALNLAIYDAPGGNLLLESETMPTNTNGEITTWVGDQVNLEPGQYIVVSDGTTTKGLILETLTFNEFDLSQGLLRGSAPPLNGRTVWVGIGWESDAWTKEVTTDPYYGYWVADFDKPVPNDYLWVAAQVFDPDGDASEVRPERVVDLWASVFTYDLPRENWTAGQHTYSFYGERNVVPHEIRQSDAFPLTVSSEAPLYDGFALLRTVMQQAKTGEECTNITAIHPNQATRFLWVWDMQSPVSYDEAVAYFDSIAAWITWDSGMTADFVRHDIISFESVEWAQYTCSFTQ